MVGVGSLTLIGYSRLHLISYMAAAATKRAGTEITRLARPFAHTRRLSVRLVI